LVITQNLKKRGRPKLEGVHEAAFDSKSWRNFTQALDTKATRIGYTHDLRKYMDYLGHDNPDKLLVGNQELLEDQIIGYITKRKEDGASSHSIRRACASIKKFYDENRTPLTWSFILSKIGRSKRKKKDKAHTREMISKMRNIADIREKPILSLYYSSGFRKGGIPELNLNSLEPIDKYGIYKIIVYEGYDEEYATYCNVECRNDLEEYFAYRIRSGEPTGPDGKLLPNAPVIRAMFDPKDPMSVKRPQRISESTIYGLIDKLANRTGLRQRVHMTEGQKPGTIRHDFKLIHGLRKFFDTQCTNSGMNLLWVELLEGHDVKLKDSYYRPTAETLLEGNEDAGMRGYVHCIDALTISEENRLRKQVAEYKIKSDKIEEVWQALYAQGLIKKG